VVISLTAKLTKHSAANNTSSAAEEYNVLHSIETVDQQISKKT